MDNDLPEQAEALGRLFYDILRTADALVTAGDALVRPLGLTSARWQVLAMAGFRDPPGSVSDLARGLSLTRQSVQRVVDELARDGMVTTADNPAHARARLITVTPQGRAALEAAEALRVPWTEGLAHQLTGHDAAAAEALLQALRRALDAQNPPIS
jgi:DNA-binding MarR family transcriptional regulator